MGSTEGGAGPVPLAASGPAPLSPCSAAVSGEARPGGGPAGAQPLPQVGIPSSRPAGVPRPPRPSLRCSSPQGGSVGGDALGGPPCPVSAAADAQLLAAPTAPLYGTVVSPSAEPRAQLPYPVSPGPVRYPPLPDGADAPQAVRAGSPQAASRGQPAGGTPASPAARGSASPSAPGPSCSPSGRSYPSVPQPWPVPPHAPVPLSPWKQPGSSGAGQLPSGVQAPSPALPDAASTCAAAALLPAAAATAASVSSAVMLGAAAGQSACEPAALPSAQAPAPDPDRALAWQTSLRAWAEPADGPLANLTGNTPLEPDGLGPQQPPHGSAPLPAPLPWAAVASCTAPATTAWGAGAPVAGTEAYHRWARSRQAGTSGGGAAALASPSPGASPMASPAAALSASAAISAPWLPTQVPSVPLPSAPPLEALSAAPAAFLYATGTRSPSPLGVGARQSASPAGRAASSSPGDLAAPRAPAGSPSPAPAARFTSSPGDAPYEVPASHATSPAAFETRAADSCPGTASWYRQRCSAATPPSPAPPLLDEPPSAPPLPGAWPAPRLPAWSGEAHGAGLSYAVSHGPTAGAASACPGPAPLQPGWLAASAQAPAAVVGDSELGAQRCMAAAPPPPAARPASLAAGRSRHGSPEPRGLQSGASLRSCDGLLGHGEADGLPEHHWMQRGAGAAGLLSRSPSGRCDREAGHGRARI
jgi:hypothetical protein